MFIEELIEKLKSGPVMCWTRGGGLIEVEKYNPGNTEPFWADGITWNIDGKLFNTREDILDFIAICRNPQLIQEQFKLDTQRVPVAGDWVVWIGDNGYLKHNEVLQVESAKGSDIVLKNNEKAHWRWCELFRFAAPEEIAAAQEPKPATPTQSSEQACSSLVMVCRGLETTKGTT